MPYFNHTKFGHVEGTHPVKRVYVCASMFADIEDRTVARNRRLSLVETPYRMHPGNVAAAKAKAKAKAVPKGKAKAKAVPKGKAKAKAKAMR